MIGSNLRFWLEHLLGARAAETQVSTAERACLARHAAGRTALVELGVMHGVTTRLLCEAMAAQGTVTGVDPFPPGRLGVSLELAVARREVARAGRGRARFLRQRSEEAIAGWSAPIDFLFIDADHSWQAIERDWRGWTPFVSPGGVVALHDSREVPGRAVYDSARFTREVVHGDARFELVEEVESLTVVRRLDTSRSA